MTERRKPRPRDPLQLAKLIGDIATGQTEDHVEDGKDPAAAELGRRGGSKGGRARADRLSPETRSEMARLAAQARWRRSDCRSRPTASSSTSTRSRKPSAPMWITPCW